jgi:hypothetical protein
MGPGTRGGGPAGGDRWDRDLNRTGAVQVTVAAIMARLGGQAHDPFCRLSMAAATVTDNRYW